MSKVKNFMTKNSMLVVLVFAMVLFEVLISISKGSLFSQGSLFSPTNLSNLISQNGYIVILATGMLLCILTGGHIDLSVGSIVALVGALAGIFIVTMGLPLPLVILLCLIAGTLIGASQAFLIAYIGIPPFITTLGGMLIFRGVALILLGSRGINLGSQTDGTQIAFRNMFTSFIPNTTANVIGNVINAALIVGAVLCIIFTALSVMSRRRKAGKGYDTEKTSAMVIRLTVICAVILFVFWRLGQSKGIPVLLIWLGVIVMIYHYFTQNTIPGRYLYAIGGNKKAAQLSGVNTKRMMFFAYTNMGFLAGLSALVYAARIGQASTTAGDGVEMDAIASCFIGGAAAYGGTGTVAGTIIGAVFMGVLNMGMSILGVDPNVQRVVKGLVLLSAVTFDVLSKNQKQMP
jgi:putative multiple sugar transport system permease protein